MEIILLLIFIIGYFFITLEHRTKISKSAVALSMGGVLWVLISIFERSDHTSELLKVSGEIFEIVVFLMAAMSLVEILIHYKLFDLLKYKISKLGLDTQKQFIIIAVITFALSGIVDNLTITIISIQIARSLFKGKNLLIVGAGIVIAANAGGAFSPIGDITTIMLWIAEKFKTAEIVFGGFLPSLGLFLVSTGLLSRKIDNKNCEECNVEKFTLSKSELTVIVMSISSFMLPLIVSKVGLPPYIGLLMGLGAVWTVIDVFKHRSHRESHLSAQIEEIIQRTDLSSIKFFIGILLSVAALNSIGILDDLTRIVYQGGSETNIIFGNIMLGPISAILDNVPLTAILIQTLHTDIPQLWVLLAITVGTGGSFLIIGSAAGVIAMGLIEKLNFKNYFQIAFIPMLAGYITAVVIWLVQYLVI